jgi:PepB aminopeptidase
MSYIHVEISVQKAPNQWGDSASLSFQSDKVIIHLDPQLDNFSQTKVVQRAAKQVEALAVSGAKLVGNWSMQQQWAFALSFTTAKKQGHIEWCDDENQQALTDRYAALVFTRDLINSTPEDLSPEALADRTYDWLKQIGGDSITQKRWVGEELQQQGWTGIYNVGRGSVRPPVLLEIDYNPSGDANHPVEAALVGKGITFDSGGYSIKSSEGMLDMKCDMGGAATVAGGLGLAIMNKLNKRVKLFVCCAENLISGHAYKLGDILTYKNGTTVEIVNTDAEGRLVLADGLMAACETGASLIIDAATLTGAAMVALGSEYNAIFALDKPLQSRFVEYAEQEDEPVWPLPLEKWHQNKCPSAFADTANSRPQKGGGGGGASNAAGFLSRFVTNEGKGWIHLDLAAAYNGKATDILPAGASGLGIRSIAKALAVESAG